MAVIFWAWLACSSGAPPAPPAPRRVWIDADTSAGVPGRDVDDAWAILQALFASELDVVGVSSVFGNADLAATTAATDAVLQHARTRGPHVRVLAAQPGAAGPGGGEGTAAVTGLGAALAAGPLDVLALGPLTNVAAALAAHPDHAENLRSVVWVAGRLPGQTLQTGTHVHRDFNLEQDAAAAERLLASDRPLVLAPWALSRQVVVGEPELARLDAGLAPAPWLAEQSRPWMAMWGERFGFSGFTPFDTLAVGVFTAPDTIRCVEGGATLRFGPDDRPAPSGAPLPEKAFLDVRPGVPGRAVRWCAEVDAPAFRAALIRALTAG